MVADVAVRYPQLS